VDGDLLCCCGSSFRSHSHGDSHSAVHACEEWDRECDCVDHRPRLTLALAREWLECKTLPRLTEWRIAVSHLDPDDRNWVPSPNDSATRLRNRVLACAVLSRPEGTFRGVAEGLSILSLRPRPG